MNISIIIPTFHRNENLAICLDCIAKQSKTPYQIIIIDNAGNLETNKLCKHHVSLNILYHNFPINSAAQARNRGIKNCLPDTDIILFIDDDTTFGSEFLIEIESFFINNSQAKGGVAHIISPTRKIGLLKKIGFLLLTGGISRDKQFVTKGGFNALPFMQSGKLQTVEWTSGCGMFFRKSVFDEGFYFPYKFLKYSLMEDCFLSYAIQRKYPKTLYYTPHVKLIHHESPSGRIANRTKIMQNIIHRYLFIKQFNMSTIVYCRTTILLGVLDFLSYKSLGVIKWYIQGLMYIRTYRNIITTDNFDYNSFIFKT